MAFFKHALSERGIAGRAAGGNSAWIKRRSFWSRAACAGVTFPVRETRFQTFWAMLYPELVGLTREPDAPARGQNPPLAGASGSQVKLDRDQYIFSASSAPALRGR